MIPSVETYEQNGRNAPIGAMETIPNAEKRQTRPGNLLLEAVRAEHSDEVFRLLDNGAAPEIRTTEDGETPLVWGCESTSLNIKEVLLERGARVDTPDFYGVTPLTHPAVNKKHKSAAQTARTSI